jgi:nucleoside transporter
MGAGPHFPPPSRAASEEKTVDVDTKTYIALSVVMFLEYAIWGAWAPVLAARLLGPLKMTGKQTGWIYATLPIACIVSPLIAGQLADKWLNMEWILIGAHLVGAVLLLLAAKQTKFVPLMWVMLFYAFCYAATMPLVNAVLFAATSDAGTQGKVFIWAPIAWALVGYTLTGWRMTRKTEGDGSDCLYFAAGLSLLMALGCFLLSANPPAATGKIPILEAMQTLGDPNLLIFILISLVVVGLMQFYFLGTAQFLQDMGVSSKHVPGSMALAQVAQAAATWFLLGFMLGDVGFKWTLTIGVACWVALYLAYIAGKPRALIIGVQPLHGLAYVFFVIVGQIFADTVAPAGIRSSMQALIFTATMGVGLLAGTLFAGAVMDRSSVDGKFQWPKVWIVPCGIMVAGMLAMLILFHDPLPQDPANEASATVAPADVAPANAAAVDFP